jgi:hypothetical protein
LRSIRPELAKAPPAEFFWETKANLTRDQVRMLSAARVNWIQPGIESLSDLTLKLMKKGSKGIQNIQLLKWTLESGIKVSWNWLFGFPGENEAEVERLSETVRAIHHLQPPNAASVLYLERFSPYHMTPEEWGLTGIRAAKAYAYVYPHAKESVDNLAFFFDCDFFSKKEGGAAFAKLQKMVARWKWAHESSHLVAIPRQGALWILDTRECRTRRLHKLTGLRREVYEHLFKARGLRKVVQHFQGRATPDEVTTLLQGLVADKLVLESDERYLGIATDARMAYRRYPEFFPGGQITPPPPPGLAQGRLARLLRARRGPAPRHRLGRAPAADRRDRRRGRRRGRRARSRGRRARRRCVAAGPEHALSLPRSVVGPLRRAEFLVMARIRGQGLCSARSSLEKSIPRSCLGADDSGGSADKEGTEAHSSRPGIASSCPIPGYLGILPTSGRRRHRWAELSGQPGRSIATLHRMTATQDQATTERDAALEQRIVALLKSNGTECVSQLTVAVDARPAHVLRALEALETQGIVERRKQPCPEDPEGPPRSRWGIRIPGWPFWRESFLWPWQRKGAS